MKFFKEIISQILGSLKSFDDHLGLTKINPYNTLGVMKKNENDKLLIKNAFYEYVNNNNNENLCNDTEISLAYYLLTTPNNGRYRIENDNEFVVTKRDQFYYTVTNNLYELKRFVDKEKNIIDIGDELGRTMLYLAARSGFYDICEFLLRAGCSINKKQVCESTSLHVAAYYGQKDIVHLLLNYGADPNIVNKYGNKAIEETKSESIKSLIKAKSDDKILKLFHTLNDTHQVKKLEIIKKFYNNRFSKIIATKIVLNVENEQCFDNKNWIQAWHGTKYSNLMSIIANGLKPAGSKLNDGTSIMPLEGHIPLNVINDGIENWSNAVFVSPSILYASHKCYSEIIESDNQLWYTLLEVELKPNSYTSHGQTLSEPHNILPNEPINLELRIEAPRDIENEDYIIRVASNSNVLVKSVVFLNKSYLDNCSDYAECKQLLTNSGLIIHHIY